MSEEEPKEELIQEDEIPDPIGCEKCGEYKTDEGGIRLYGMLFGSLRGTDDFTKEQLEKDYTLKTLDKSLTTDQYILQLANKKAQIINQFLNMELIFFDSFVMFVFYHYHLHHRLLHKHFSFE